MKTTIALRSVLMLSAVAMVAGCDNHTGPPATSPLNPSPAPAPAPAPTPLAVSKVISYGTVTAIGEVRVNGVPYDTREATFTINGKLGSQSGLDVGDVVLVVGTIDAPAGTGVAEHVVFDNLVEAPIGAIDIAANSFVAIGQTVEITESTIFGDSLALESVGGFRIGDVVAVSGFRNLNGTIKATRIAQKEPVLDEVKTIGRVANHDVVARRFAINELSVDYSRAALLEAFPAGVVGNDNVVEARGSLQADGVLVANSVKLIGAVPASMNDRVQIEGYVRDVKPVPTVCCAPPLRRFALEWVLAETALDTMYEGNAYDLLADTKVQVKGALRADGVLVATAIKFSPVDPVDIKAQIDSVSEVAGSLTTLGITVKTGAFTRITDESAARLDTLRLKDLVAGDYVSIRGVDTAYSGEVRASVIERHDALAETELKGRVRSIHYPPGNAPFPITLEILGVTVVANPETVYGWGGRVYPGVGAGTFFFDLDRYARARGVRADDRTIEASVVLAE